MSGGSHSPNYSYGDFFFDSGNINLLTNNKYIYGFDNVGNTVPLMSVSGSNVYTAGFGLYVAGIQFSHAAGGYFKIIDGFVTQTFKADTAGVYVGAETVPIKSSKQVAHAWWHIYSTGTLAAGYGVDSIVDNGPGDHSAILSVNCSTYGAAIVGHDNGADEGQLYAQTATAIRCRTLVAGTPTDAAIHGTLFDTV